MGINERKEGREKERDEENDRGRQPVGEGALSASSSMSQKEKGEYGAKLSFHFFHNSHHTFSTWSNRNDADFDEKIIPFESQSSTLNFARFFAKNRFEFVQQNVEISVRHKHRATVRLREHRQGIFGVVKHV